MWMLSYLIWSVVPAIYGSFILQLDRLSQIASRICMWRESRPATGWGGAMSLSTSSNGYHSTSSCRGQKNLHAFDLNVSFICATDYSWIQCFIISEHTPLPYYLWAIPIDVFLPLWHSSWDFPDKDEMLCIPAFKLSIGRAHAADIFWCYLPSSKSDVLMDEHGSWDWWNGGRHPLQCLLHSIIFDKIQFDWSVHLGEGLEELISIVDILVMADEVIFWSL